MLLSVFTLFSALALVSSHKAVTQTPLVLTEDSGKTVTMDCNIARDDGYYVSWYKVTPGETPEFVLRFHHSHSSPDKYGDNFSSTRFTSKASTTIDYQLSSHRDTMLPALSFLLTALSCVGGVTVVTQKPPVLTLTSGETATLDCNLGSVTNEAAQWYKQVPGGVPQFVIYHYHGHSGPRYGSGFSSPKFTSTHSTKSDYKLIISKVEVGDSAVYYCKTWDTSAKDYVSQ